MSRVRSVPEAGEHRGPNSACSPGRSHKSVRTRQSGLPKSLGDQDRSADVARDLESAAPKPEAATESELLGELRRRVERIEQHLGIVSTRPYDDDPDRS